MNLKYSFIISKFYSVPKQVKNETPAEFFTEFFLFSDKVKILICFSTSLDPTEGTWLGLTDEVQEGEFRWLNGDVLRYNEWKVNEPNGRKQANCVVAFGNKMLDFSCSYSKHMMCSTIGRNKYFFPLQAQAWKPG